MQYNYRKKNTEGTYLFYPLYQLITITTKKRQHTLYQATFLKAISICEDPTSEVLRLNSHAYLISAHPSFVSRQSHPSQFATLTVFREETYC
jgi:hypothetical protein